MGQFCEKSYSDSTYKDGGSGSGGDRGHINTRLPRFTDLPPSLTYSRKNPPINKLFCEEQIVTSMYG